MDEPHLYRKIADSIRQEILTGRLKPGDRLASVREMALEWGCTIGTVQHAYQELAQQGLLVSRSGQGTRVVERPALPDETPLRRANLVHRSETFLLEVLTAGYTPAEVEAAMRQALDRWRVIVEEPAPAVGQALRFSGSHDLAITWLASHFGEIAPGSELELNFTGSLGGLIALAEGRADLAGSHLWDEETDTYNLPFIKRLFPNRRVALVTLAHRQMGWMVAPGNPAGMQRVEDAGRPGLRLVVRQSGSGTRVWFDAALRRAGLESEKISQCAQEAKTHSEAARWIAEGQADAGLGLEAAARQFGLDFVHLNLERYDLVIPEASMQLPPVIQLIDWLKRPEARAALSDLGGYDLRETGRIVWG
jgi:molybdate-binding protein/DNA-binding transcriptional regulator YhcF (GntR family)